MQLFRNLYRATFISRPNRYTVWCGLEGRREKAYLPNPGRLEELFFPGSVLYLEKAENPERATLYTAVAVQREGLPVMLHTHRTNDVAGHLIEMGRVPGLEGAEILRREVTQGRSRFDFLLGRGREKIFVEVKSCTLFSRHVAMFPDAVTARGTKHVNELAALPDSNTSAVVLFVVHTLKPRCFLPEYHRDPAFAQALFLAREKVRIIPMAIGWNQDLTLQGDTRVLEIPWQWLEREAHDRGSYLIVLHLAGDCVIEIGKLGRIRFRKGYYVYVGSAMSGLTKRIARHQRLRKKKFWHIDYLRSACRFMAGLPVRASADLECAIAQGMHRIAAEEVPDFGSSDCSCRSHLFRMDRHPLDAPEFHALLQQFRMDRAVSPVRPAGRKNKGK
ncbi:MAG: DNA/RNA nuclease SfsA [Planctomycetota bacterium]